MTESSDPIPFTPVPSASNRRDGWTPDRQRVFIDALSQLGNVSAAARIVGKSAKSVYALRKRAGGDSFTAAWDQALDEGYENALQIVVTRIREGEIKPVMYRGRQVGERRKYDDKLLLAALNIRARLREAGAPKEEWNF